MNEICMQNNGKCDCADLFVAGGIYLRSRSHHSLLAVLSAQLVIAMRAMYGPRAVAHSRHRRRVGRKPPFTCDVGSVRATRCCSLAMSTTRDPRAASHYSLCVPIAASAMCGHDLGSKPQGVIAACTFLSSIVVQESVRNIRNLAICTQ